MSAKRILSAAKHPKKVARAIGYRLLSSFGTFEFTPFIVLTRARTGSNLLISMLDSHPNIRAEGELFRDLSRGFYETALGMVFSKQPRHIKASGFKIFYNHTLKDGAGGVWGRLERMEDLCVIHLKRRNILRTLVSRKIAGQQGVWLANSAAGVPPRSEKAVSLDPQELQAAFERVTKQEEEGDRRFRLHRRIGVNYEDLVSQAEDVFRQLTEFLDVPYVVPEIKLRRQNPEPLKELVVNFDELTSKFAETQWRHFFED